MTQTHPITPPRELVEQLEEQWCDMPVIRPSINSYMATQGAQWGYQQAVKELETFLRKSNEMKTVTDLAQQIADQELEACCEWVNTWCTPRYLRDPSKWGGPPVSADVLRAARRPKPPSLK